MRVDSHVHIWDTAYPCAPHQQIPPIPGDSHTLLSNLDTHDVSSALAVQPIHYGADHTCLLNAAGAAPKRIYPVALAAVDQGADFACSELDRLVKQHNVKGVRVNPKMAPWGLDDPAVHAVAQCAGKLDVPVNLFVMPRSLDGAKSVVERSPDTTFILDHFGFAEPGTEGASQRLILELGKKYQNFAVKASAWFRVSKAQWPHADLHPFLLALVSALGARRVMLG